jgi:hypothetical protein
MSAALFVFAQTSHKTMGETELSRHQKPHELAVSRKLV